MKKTLKDWQAFTVACDRAAERAENEREATTLALDIDRMANYIESRLMAAQRAGLGPGDELDIALPAFGWALTEVTKGEVSVG